MGEKYAPKVSVIIPIYNAEVYLASCLDSVIAQTLAEIEIICIDDGSTDRSFNILEEYKNIDNRIKVITQENQYAGVARNKGMEVATGQYYVFWDADDYFENDALEVMYNKITQMQADVCLCGADRIDIRDGSVTKMTWVLKTVLMPNKAFFSPSELENIFSITSPAPWSKMFSADFVKRFALKFQDIKRINDMFFVYSALALASRITVVDDALIHYRFGQETSLQSTITEDPTVCCQALLALKGTIDNCGERIRGSFYNLCVNNILHNYNLCKENISVASELLEEISNHYMCELGLTDDNKFIKDSKQYHKLVILIKKNIKANKFKYIENAIKEYTKPAKRYEGKAIQPIVSIIIPIYNTEKYLAECIDSVLNQSFEEIEIICVNDGSTDSSLDILEDYYLYDDRLAIISQKNKGLSLARNIGIAYASGKYIQFLDSDDYLSCDAIEKLYKYAENSKLDIVFYGAKTLYENENLQKSHPNMAKYYYVDSSMEGKYTGVDFFKKIIQMNCFVPSATLQFYNKKFIMNNKLLFYPGIYHEDNLFTFYALLCADSVSRYGMSLYCRRIREQSITTVEKSFKHFYGYFKCYILMQSFMELRDPLKTLPHEIYSFVNHIKRTLLRLYSILPEDELKQIETMTKFDMIWYNSIFIDQDNQLKANHYSTEKHILTIRLINPFRIIQVRPKEVYLYCKRYGFLPMIKQSIKTLQTTRRGALAHEGVLISISIRKQG